MVAPSTPRPKRCPVCGCTSIARIQFGLPARNDEELWKQVENKEVVLGGCCPSGFDPEWHCNACSHRWRWAPDNFDDPAGP